MIECVKTVNFGSDLSGLTTIGYTLINGNGSIKQPRTTIGIFEVQENSGIYATNIIFDSEWSGIILWDDDNNTFASEDLNYQIGDSTLTNNVLDIVSGFIVNNEITENFTVTDTTGNLIVGIITSEFTWNLFDPNGDDSTSLVFISELGNGSYRIKFIPDIIGSWYLIVYHHEYFPWGKAESFWVINDTSMIVSEIVDGIEFPGGKLDTIYEKLPDNQIADSQDSTSILNIVTDIDNNVNIINDTVNDIDNNSNIIINITNDIDNKIDILSIDCTNLDYKIDIINTKCNEISDDLKRVLGLVHENIFIDLPSYDDNSNLISARLRIYSNESDVGSNNNIIGTYLIESDSSGPGKFTNWRQVRL